jgi:leader peptidase (prepilin peptidase)/N-methyltransferase
MSREALIEIGGAAAAFGLAGLVALAPGADPALATIALALVVGWIVWRDATAFVIPDGASLALGALALGARLAAEGLSAGTALWALAGGALCGAALWAVREAFFRLRGHDGLGFGDVKLATAAGVLVGPAPFALALVIACLAGLAVALARGSRAGDRLPLGALLAPAVFAVWIGGLADMPGPAL